jgi:hypothetical protein
MAEFTPTILPCESTNGPPELPGLIAASVWIASIKLSAFNEPVVTGRFRAETIPLVTVPDKPRGEPKAITGSPIERVDEFPIAISGRFPFLIEIIARSYSEFRPTIVAGNTSPLFNSTSICPETAAASITWLFVIIN